MSTPPRRGYHHDRGTALNATRVARGLTCEQVSDLVGVTPAAVRNWMSGRRIPRAPQLILLAKAFSLSVPEVHTLLTTPMHPQEDAP